MQDETRMVIVEGIEMPFAHYPKQAQAGDSLGLWLRGVERNELSRGQVLATLGSIKTHKIFKTQIYVLSKEEGGRHTPFYNGYRLCFYIRTTDIVGQVTLPDSIDKVMPGESVAITVQLIVPVALEKGTRFVMREGGRTVCVGVCTEVIN